MTRKSWGSIRSTGQGVWELSWPQSPCPETGARRRGYETVRGSRRAAEHRLAQLRSELQGVAEHPDHMTLGQFWDEIYYPGTSHLADSTRSGYMSMYRCHIQPRFGSRVMSSIGAQEVQAWLSGMSYGSAKGARRTLRAIMTRAYDLDIIDRNVMTKRYQMPQESEKVRTPNEERYTPAELTAILEDARGEVWEPLFIFGGFGGMRRSEAAGMRLEDVTFRGGFAICDVNKGVQVVNRETGVHPLKTKSSYRSVVVPEPGASRLRELKEEYSAEGYQWFTDNGFGQPANPDTVASAYRRWFTGRPYKFVPLKNLRASYATIMHELGVDFAMVSKMLGHTSPDTTYRFYDDPGIDAFINSSMALAVEMEKNRQVTDILEFQPRISGNEA